MYRCNLNFVFELNDVNKIYGIEFHADLSAHDYHINTVN